MIGIKEYYGKKPFDVKAYKKYLHSVKAENFVLSFLLLQDEKILRSRVNEDCKFFTKLKDISYPPEDKARTDRASLKGKPMFYGSVFTHQNSSVFLPRITNLLETSEFFRDEHSSGRKVLTQSVWFNNRPLKLAMLPISTTYEIPCDELTYIQQQFREQAEVKHVSLSEDAILLGDLFAKENDGIIYMLTAYFVDYLLNESSDSDYFDGVAYPSVPSKGLGMNICIRPSLVDEGVVHCGGAQESLLIKDKKECKLSPLFQGDIFENGEIKWRNSKELNQAIISPDLFQDLFYL